MGNAFDRRVGRRLQVDPRQVGWRVTPPGEKQKRRLGLFAQPHQVGRLLEVSVSGLQVRAPAASDLGPGARIWIEVEGLVGEVRIRRVLREPGAKKGSGDSVYGVEMVDEHCELTTHIHRLIDEQMGTKASMWHSGGWD